MSSQSRPGASRPCGCGGTSHASPSPSGCGCGGGGGGHCGCGTADCHDGTAVRPRFFAGQLLTEEDLQALSDYVAAKGRLHNRSFFGEGVVCGFEVTCHPCGQGKVIVHPGHALDCCGNDIVLACAQTLDVNALVRDLRQSLLGGYDCGDPCAEKPAVAAKDVRSDTVAGIAVPVPPAEKPAPIVVSNRRHYCLYVRYCEALTDPVSAYVTDEPCGTTGCEPTRVREGLRFELRCRGNAKPPKGLIDWVAACLGSAEELEKLIEDLKALDDFVRHPEETDPATGAGPNVEEIDKKLCDLREKLLDRLDAAPDLARCSLRNDVLTLPVSCPPQQKPLDSAVRVDSARKLVAAWWSFWQDCLCHALLPPCAPCDDPGVLLACLEVESCEVVKICNLERTLVPTVPALRHWVPIHLLGESIEKLCCQEIHWSKPSDLRQVFDVQTALPRPVFELVTFARESRLPFLDFDVLSRFRGFAPQPAEPAAPTAAPAPESFAAPPAPDPALLRDLESLRSELRNLAQRNNDLEKRLKAVEGRKKS